MEKVPDSKDFFFPADKLALLPAKTKVAVDKWAKKFEEDLGFTLMTQGMGIIGQLQQTFMKSELGTKVELFQNFEEGREFETLEKIGGVRGMAGMLGSTFDLIDDMHTFLTKQRDYSLILKNADENAKCFEKALELT